MKTTTGIKLDETTRQRLKVLSELKERAPHWLMKRAIQEYLDREEHFEREKQEDMQRWQEYTETDQYIKQDEMRKKLKALIDVPDIKPETTF